MTGLRRKAEHWWAARQAGLGAVAAGIVPGCHRSTTMTTNTESMNKRKPRRMAREPDVGASATALAPQKRRSASKLDQVEALLIEPTGASIAELMVATGWQQHSVRGAMAGALKKRGLVITSDKIDDTRRYRAVKSA